MEKEKDMQAIKIIFDIRCKFQNETPKHIVQEAEYLADENFDLSKVRQFCWQHSTRIENRLKQDQRIEFAKSQTYLMPVEQVESPKILNDANALKLISGQVKDLLKEYACTAHVGTSLRFSAEFNHLLDLSTQGPKQQKSYEQTIEV